MKVVIYVSLPKIEVSDISAPVISYLAQILKYICEVDEVGVFDVKGKRRFTKLITARREFCYIARRITNKSLAEIGGEINRDHATALHHVRKSENWLKIPGYKLAEKLDEIEERLS